MAKKPPTIGDLIRARQKALNGVTLRELGRRFNFNGQLLAKYANNKFSDPDPQLSTMRALARVCGVPLHDIADAFEGREFSEDELKTAGLRDALAKYESLRPAAKEKLELLREPFIANINRLAEEERK